jgi:prepilin-type N-terminal cleavage/methylation domain-containing protein
MRTVLRAGFTLMEIVVVLIIISMGAALAVPAFRSFFQQDDLTEATHTFETLFSFARDSAIRGGLPVTVLVDSTSGRVWLDSPSPDIDPDTMPQASPGGAFGSQALHAMGPATRRIESVDDGEPLDLPASVRIALTRARARFTFEPSGAAFADSILLTTTTGQRLLTLNRWTGDVVVF